MSELQDRYGPPDVAPDTEPEQTKEVIVTAQRDPIPLDEDGLPAPRNLDELFRVAKMFTQSNLVPKDYQITVPKNEDIASMPPERYKQLVDYASQKIVVATLMGREIGLKFMASLRSIAVINGRPSVWGDAVPALVIQSQGDNIEDIKEYYKGTGEATIAYCEIKLRNRPSWIKASFGVEDAKVAGLWGNEKKSTWKHYWKRMLKMRAREAFRDADPGALMGLLFAEVAMDLDPEVPEAQVVPSVMPPDQPTEPAADEVVDERPSTDPDPLTKPQQSIDKTNELIDSFLKDQTSTEDDYTYITKRFGDFLDACVVWYKADKDLIKQQMVEQGLETAWDRFQEWILDEKRKEAKDAKQAKKAAKDMDAKPKTSQAATEAPDDTESDGHGNVWKTPGWKHQGGQKFKKYVYAHLAELYAMPDDFVKDIQLRWNNMDLGKFPEDPQPGPPAATLSPESDDIQF